MAGAVEGLEIRGGDAVDWVAVRDGTLVGEGAAAGEVAGATLLAEGFAVGIEVDFVGLVFFFLALGEGCSMDKWLEEGLCWEILECWAETYCEEGVSQSSSHGSCRRAGW